ncbi:ABC transporter permease [Streptococcus sp. HF-1907]|uniref:permease-like cell division protein FtsX n=1 Tax=Streptococcus sp. HF-1907 TaxID=2785793 RepID=UPI00189F4294|nr:permease-like cell division protein FtsX [Streptococcus sp. HF-1907]MBF7094635.1 ABC transporter permease [Streptococcus sp. HF-1907]
MISNFFRHLWESIKNLKRNFWMTFASVSMVTFTLTLLGIFAGVLMNVTRITTAAENNIKINVYLDYGSTDNSKTKKDAGGATVDNGDYHKIYDQIKSISGVKSVTYSSKEEQLKKVQEQYGSDVFDDQYKDSLQDAYIVQTTSSAKVKSVNTAIKKIEGVDTTNYGGVDSDRLFNIAKLIRVWGLAGTAVLIVIAIFLISNTIRMTIMARKRDIEIMRLVGAKNSYIRGPFFFEGAWVGLLGAIIPSLIIYFGYTYIYNTANAQLQLEGMSLYPTNLFFPAVIGGLFIIGIIIGSLGAILSMRRYLKI